MRTRSGIAVAHGAPVCILLASQPVARYWRQAEGTTERGRGTRARTHAVHTQSASLPDARYHEAADLTTVTVGYINPPAPAGWACRKFSRAGHRGLCLTVAPPGDQSPGSMKESRLKPAASDERAPIRDCRFSFRRNRLFLPLPHYSWESAGVRVHALEARVTPLVCASASEKGALTFILSRGCCGRGGSAFSAAEHEKICTP